MSSQQVFSFNDDIGKQIDDKRFDQQFFVNKRGLFNHQVNPHARTNRVYDGNNNLRLVFPQDANPPVSNDYVTRCCNTPTETVISGKRNEDTPIEGTSVFWSDLRTTARRIPPKTTTTIGLDQSENS
jgi:hypothetical protein